MRKHLLITGFGPFPGMAINPSARLAEALAARPCWSWLDWKVRAAILPVGYGPTEKALERLLEKKPRAVLMFGVAARRKAISIEMVARNRASRTQRDQSGRLPRTSALDDGPPMLKGRAPMRVLRDGMRHFGLPTTLSRNAGPYLCNAGYRFVLRRTSANIPVVFVHIPRVQRSGDARGLHFAPLLKGSEAIARRLVLAARLSAR
ncbi:MAG: peptidase C15 [Rhizobiales bacterium]|nr:peptidase C15 [Hyphomicrobiales bacterium]